MRRNIFGNFDVTPEDYSVRIVKELKYTQFISIKPNYKTNKGVIANDFIDGAGIYFIYHKEDLIYIGHTTNNVRDRIGRFFAGVRGTERHDENHPAAYKFLKFFGRKCEDLTLKIIPLEFSSLLCDVTMEDIEMDLIYELKPLFNNQIYRNRDILSTTLELET